LIGFFTEEVREHGQRTGFDIVSVNGERAVLARKAALRELPGGRSSCMVGSYRVHTEEFEKLALLSLEYKCEQGQLGPVVIIDEVGKMEQFSKKFIEKVRQVWADPAVMVIATVPAKPLPLVEEIRLARDTVQFVVTPQNRANLLAEILSAVEKS